MTLRRWRDSLAPPLLAIAAVAAVVVPATANNPPTTESGRAGAGLVAESAPLGPCQPDAAAARPAAGRSLAGSAWYRLDPVVDGSGWLTGQRLVAGRVAERGAFELALPVESFVSGPRGGRLLVGADDGRRSTIRVVDVARRCATTIHEGAELIRRAVLTPDQEALVEFRLDRATRTDRGIWLRPLDGTEPVRLVEPLAPSDRIGRVFSTALQWSSDGRTLAINSCGERACLVRLLDRTSGRLTTVDDERVGELLGVVDGDLVAYGGCPALPCEIVARNLGTGRLRIVARSAGLASVGSAGGGIVAFEDAGSGGRLAIARLDGRGIATIELAGDLRLVPSEARALAGLETGAGVVAVAPRGRPSSARLPASFVDLADGRLLPAEEVVR